MCRGGAIADGQRELRFRIMTRVKTRRAHSECQGLPLIRDLTLLLLLLLLLLLEYFCIC